MPVSFLRTENSSLVITENSIVSNDAIVSICGQDLLRITRSKTLAIPPRVPRHALLGQDLLRTKKKHNREHDHTNKQSGDMGRRGRTKREDMKGQGVGK